MPTERRLIVRHGGQVREVLLVGTVSVGRNPSCEISEADPLLSREHAEFRVTGTDVFVKDLGSRNGTRVNGKPIKEERLVPGDRVEVGPLVIEYVAPIEARLRLARREHGRRGDRGAPEASASGSPVCIAASPSASGSTATAAPAARRRPLPPAPAEANVGA